MKRICLILLFSGLVVACFSQIPEVQVDRRIYLWDVTLSMQGYQGKTPDIWNDVTAFIKKDLERISDENTELVILPFQTDILVYDWSEKATMGGKTRLLNKIDEAKTLFKNPTNTNIASPFRKVMDKYIDKRRNNLVILLTDGKQNVDGGQAAWRNLLSEWHPFAKENNAYLIYMMLTSEAVDDDLKNYMDSISTGETVSPEESTAFEYINFRPKRKICFNVTGNDDVVEIRIPLENSKKGLPIVDGVLMSVKSEPNTLLDVNENVEVVNDMLNVRLGYSIKDLKDLMDIEESVSVPLILSLLNQDEIQQKYHKRLILTQQDVELVLINKIQKTLTITLKR